MPKRIQPVKVQNLEVEKPSENAKIESDGRYYLFVCLFVNRFAVKYKHVLNCFTTVS